jgi:long-chain acyl-CoA synthetase
VSKPGSSYAATRFRDLTDVFERSVRRYAARPLFGTREPSGYRYQSYREFGLRVDMLRAALKRRGLSRGDRVALIAPNSPEWATVAYAVFTCGGVLVPIYPYQRYDDWLDILRDAQPRFVFAYGIEAASAVQGWRSELPNDVALVCMHDRGVSGAPSLEELLGEAFGHEEPIHTPDPDELCQLIYTSGTTGRPKGVQLSHKNLASNISDLHQIFPVNQDDRSLAFLPWAHAFGQVVELHGLLSVGASLALTASEDEIVGALREVQPTLLFSVPRLFNRLYETVRERVGDENPLVRRMFESGLDNARVRRRIRASGRARGAVELKAKLFDTLVFERIRQQFGGRLRYAVCGGAPLAPEVAEFVDSVGITLYEGYGLTEASPIVSANWPGGRRLGSVGKPLPSVRVLIDHGAVEGTRDGEIVVYGPNVMRGYYGLREETGVALTPDGGLRTGDLGYLDKDGFLFVTGRIKEQYKLDNGRFVVPSPLEGQLKLSELVADVMVYGEGRQFNVALIVPDFNALNRWATEQRVYADGIDGLLTHHEVRARYLHELVRVSEHAREYEKIRDFVLLPRPFSAVDGTLTSTQKLRRREIAQRYAKEIEALYTPRRPTRDSLP